MHLRRAAVLKGLDMRYAPLLEAERGRVRVGPMASDPSWCCCGAFLVKSPVDRELMNVIASNGAGWDHVSVSREDRCPTWAEMEFVRSLFFQNDETVMQLSVPREQHISICDTCLHMWRPQHANIPRPPAWMVGPVPTPQQPLDRAG